MSALVDALVNADPVCAGCDKHARLMFHRLCVECAMAGGPAALRDHLTLMAKLKNDVLAGFDRAAPGADKTVFTFGDGTIWDAVIDPTLPEDTVWVGQYTYKVIDEAGPVPRKAWDLIWNNRAGGCLAKGTLV